ncbi:MAG TPA: polysaccharide biosynthesis tyrosine autokinase, partial [Flavobacteriales bacterium]
RSQINVTLTDPDAKTVSIACRDKNPILARDLAQTMAEAFIEFDVERKSQSAESILRFIESQKADVFEDLRRSEYDLQEFKRDNKVANMEQLVPLLLERTDEYEDELLKLRIEDNLLLEVERSTQGQVEQVDSYTLIPLLVGTSFEQTLAGPIKTLEELLDRKQEYAGEMTPVNEAVMNVERRIALQQRMVLESITTLRSRIASRQHDIEAKIKEYESRFSTVPEKELAYARVARLFNINEKYYTQLLEKDIEYRISRAGFVPENSVLESAVVPLSPLSPDRNLVIISYLATGMIIGFLIVLVRYVLHDNITSLNDIVKASNSSISVLGMIPKYKKEIPVSQLLVDKNPKSLIAESFRSVRTNLDFVDNSPGARIIAVTSTISGEGKTFVAINLAGIISFSGKRVIILDLDMRKPKIHLGFGVDNAMGMSTLLINRNTMDECIQRSAMLNLDLITAGPIPPNPSELIISPRMTDILEELKTRYDVILIDNPPVGLVTDGIAMIQKADIPIYIFRSDYSKKTFVHNADRLINENRISKLSAVLNGVDIDRNKYGYNYGYGYGYGYGAGYGYYEERANTRRPRTGMWDRIKGKSS